MPQGSKAAYTDKQKRQAGHIEEGYRERGVSKKTAEARAWATVNKQDGGGKKETLAREEPAKDGEAQEAAGLTLGLGWPRRRRGEGLGKAGEFGTSVVFAGDAGEDEFTVAVVAFALGG